MQTRKTISRAVLVIYIIAVAIACFSRFNSGIDLSSEWFGIPKDKIVHFAMFLPYPVLMYMAFYQTGHKPAYLVLFLCAIIAVGGILAGTTELIQGLLAYRSADINDFRADCLGIMTGSILTTAYSAIAKKW